MYQPTHSTPHWLSMFLTGLSLLLRAIWLFFPGVLFLLLGFFAFVIVEQGQDLLVQSLALSNLKRLYILLGLSFWSFTGWYTSRILAYNDNEIFKKSALLSTVMPRLIAYVVATILGIAYYRVVKNNAWPCLFIAVSLGLFALITWLAESKAIKKYTRSFHCSGFLILYLVFALFGLILIWNYWDNKNSFLVLSGLVFIQASMLFWTSFRSKPQDSEPWSEEDCKKKLGLLWRLSRLFGQVGGTFRTFFLQRTATPRSVLDWILAYLITWNQSLVQEIYRPAYKKMKGRDEQHAEAFITREYTLFFVYNLIAILALAAYFGIIGSIIFGREVGSFAFTLLAFAILLGVGNIIALLSFRTGINWHFVFISLVVIIGFWTEPHTARVIEVPNKNTYNQRPDLKTYLEWWCNDPVRKAILENSEIDTFPVLFVLADGGASRSAYWTANVLSKLHQDSKLAGGHSLLSRHLLALAGASGGSVGNATFVAALKAQQIDSTIAVANICSTFLKNDFLTYPLARMLGPELVNIGRWCDRAVALEQSMENPDSTGAKGMSIFVDVLKNDFKRLIPRIDTQSKWLPPILCINTTCMQNSQPGVIINVKDAAFYPRLDVLNEMDCHTGIRLSTAMVLGSRFPYFSPAGRLHKIYYVDGGYFDNSGAGPVIQMLFRIEALKKELEAKGDETSFLAKSLKKLRYHVIHLQNNPLKKKNEYPKIHPLLNDLAAPLITLSGSYGSQTNFNDHRLKIYLEQIDGHRELLNLYQKKEDRLPMSWSFSKPAVDTMNARVKSCEGVDKVLKRLKKTDSLNVKTLATPRTSQKQSIQK
jgi:hypothetical protein